ncbi:MAG: polyphosphate kinase 1 [Ignavibacteriaceae bacterium]|nr:polyphosphate kinase 1 [Ignavibacteriaceae bacterium]
MAIPVKYKKYLDKSNFFNRDLSWVEFNRRVLDEALNPNLPLLDKVKFISIFCSNLDEFYMIRVAGLKEQVAEKIQTTSMDGLTPFEQLKRIEQKVKPLINTITSYWQEHILPELNNNSVFITKLEKLPENQKTVLSNYFKKEIFPILTPLAFDPGRPFPYISNLSLSLAVLIETPKGERHFARVKVPTILPRLLPINKILEKGGIPAEQLNGTHNYLWIEDFIESHLDQLFPRMKVIESHNFRLTRDTDIEIQEDEADDLLQIIQENIKQRKFGNVVRLEVEKSIPSYMLETLIENLEISKQDVHVIDGPLALSGIMSLYDLPFPNLKEKPFYPVLPKIFEQNPDIFSVIRERDILLHHPYDSFNPVIDFIKQASVDPDVLAIKQTLYRVGKNSPVVRSLIEAAERGKQVAVLVELKARFDEENNIYWAQELEKVGAHVVYGLVGLKTHGKMTLVVRREPEGVKRYVHLATGNYNASTAKLYSDMGLFTCNEDICEDVSEIFNFLTGYSKLSEFKKLYVAPINLRESIASHIQKEIENAKKGLEARIIIKVNSLVDPTLIGCLYAASNAGVKIQLVVRGICCLKPGVPGLSENITVISIVGRFLEHHRIFYFYNNGGEDLFLSSADIMQRNLEGRVELAFPVLDPEIKNHIRYKVLNVMLQDNIKARILNQDMTYSLLQPMNGDKPVCSQESFIDFALQAAGKKTLFN